MCGIIAAFGKDPQALVMEQYQKQWSRGNDGFGYIALKANKIVEFVRATTEREIENALMKSGRNKPDAILFHHRFPTSTINVIEAAHPLPISSPKWQHDYFILHNGVITDADTAVEKIEERGYEFKSRVSKVTQYRAGKNLYEVVDESEVNDSEALGFYIAELLEGKRKDIPVFGAIACLVVQKVKKTGYCRIYAMRNYGNPLLMARDKERGTVLIASEAKDGAPIPTGQIHRLTQKLTFTLEYNVAIGRSYTGQASYAAPYSDGYGFRDDDRGRYIKDADGQYIPAKHRIGKENEVITTTPTNDEQAAKILADLAGLGNDDDDSSSAVIERAITAAREAADVAFNDFTEAQAMITNLESNLSESDRAEMKDYAEELRLIWVNREDELEELLEENGQSYDPERARDTDGAFA